MLPPHSTRQILIQFVLFFKPAVARGTQCVIVNDTYRKSGLFAQMAVHQCSKIRIGFIAAVPGLGAMERQAFLA
jgi:hypothetical protein